MSRKLSRRQFVAATALLRSAFTAPYVRGAYAAGKLSMGFWDHWVPGANKTSTDLVNEWAEKEKVEVQIDYITSQGNKLLLTALPKRRPNPVTIFWRCRLGCRTPTPICSSRSTRSWSRSSSRTARLTTRSNISAKPTASGSAFPPLRQPDQGALLADRPDEEIRQYRRAGDVSGGQPAEGR